MKALQSTLQTALCAVIGFFPFFSANAAETDPDFAAVEKQFRELPPEARQSVGPLFWLHGDESKERLEMYVGKVAEGGNGCFTTESRPHKDWLGEGWWNDLGVCLGAAKQKGLGMYIFDEKMWPSQAIGGKVPPRYAAKRLEASAKEVTGPRLFEAAGYGGPGYIATVAGQLTASGKIEGETLVDLKSSIKDGKLSWQAPAGKWRIIKFTHKQAPGLIQQGGAQLAVDGASKDCVNWFIQTVYQPHFDHFEDDFGKTIRGFFYDEPETPGDWGAELDGILSERKVDWKKAYVAYKFELSGEEQVAARYQYLDAFAEAWGRTMYGGMTEWCHRHNVTSMGHFMEHGNCYFNREFCAGNMMSLQGYSDMGAIDAVFTQFAPGQRAPRDAPCWQTPKLASSVSHAYGKKDDIAMVEIFGARGQDLTYPEMKWWADHMQVSGVNFLIPHSFNPRAPYDTDCPPYFYNGGFEPRWPLYRVFADYTSRLSTMLTGGRHVCPVALLFMGQSAQLGKYVAPDQISESLQDALYDCDWMPYDVFENKTTLAAKNIQLRAESYKVLVVPPVDVIPFGTLAKAKEFFDNGGVIVAHGFLPKQSATPDKTSGDIARLCEAVWGSPQPGLGVCKTNAAGGRSYLLPEKPTPEQLQQVLAGDAGVHPTLEVLEGATDHWLHVLHRVKAGRDIFFVVNQNYTGAARTFRFRITADGVPECWDAVRNEITAIPCSRNGHQVDLALTMEPNESVLLVFQPKDRGLPIRQAPSSQWRTVASITRDPTPAQPEPALEGAVKTALQLTGSSWVWFPEETTAPEAPPGTRYFRKQISLAGDQRIKKATFVGSADNTFTLFVNSTYGGQSSSSGDGWRSPVSLDITPLLRPGANQLAIVAVNTGDKPNPAGLIGRLMVQLEDGSVLSQRVDKSWKAFDQKCDRWTDLAFDDSAWVPARETVPFGGPPWGVLTGGVTLSLAKADPFFGHCMAYPGATRIYLDLDGISPEAAARITVNDNYAGGFISPPCRLDVTQYLKPGTNTICIEPFAPKAVRLVIKGY